MFITTLDFNKVIIPPSYSNREKKVCQWTNYFRYIDRSSAQPAHLHRTPPSYTVVLLLLLSITASAIPIVPLQLSSYDIVLTIAALTIVITTSVVSCIVVTPHHHHDQ